MYVIVNNEIKEIGAHIHGIEEVLVPNFICCKYAENKDEGMFILPPEDFEMWDQLCEASEDLDDIYPNAKNMFDWDLY